MSQHNGTAHPASLQDSGGRLRPEGAAVHRTREPQLRAGPEHSPRTSPSDDPLPEFPNRARLRVPTAGVPARRTLSPSRVATGPVVGTRPAVHQSPRPPAAHGKKEDTGRISPRNSPADPLPLRTDGREQRPRRADGDMARSGIGPDTHLLAAPDANSLSARVTTTSSGKHASSEPGRPSDKARAVTDVARLRRVPTTSQRVPARQTPSDTADSGSETVRTAGTGTLGQRAGSHKSKEQLKPAELAPQNPLKPHKPLPRVSWITLRVFYDHF